MVHSMLRKNTRDFHAALGFKLRCLLSDQLTLDQYAAVQKKFYGY